MMKRTFILIGACILLVLTMSIVGVTYAYFSASSQTLENEFTAGRIQIDLKENTGSNYLLLPGVVLQKDPTLYVEAGSEDCWLFVRLQKSEEVDSFMTYALADGWMALSGVDGVYYRAVERSSSVQSFAVLQDNCMTVRDTVTEEQLKALSKNLTLTVRGYAIQRAMQPDVHAAWENLMETEE